MESERRRTGTSVHRLLRQVVEVGRRHRQAGLYMYLLLVRRDGAGLDELYRVYNMFTRHRTTVDTVRKQLVLLERKGLIKRVGDKYCPVAVPGEALAGLFDTKRSRVGQWGAQKSLLRYLYDKELPAVPRLSPKLRRKLEEVLKVAVELVEKGKREVALDLLAHTLLPVRKTGVLWLWRGDTFIYYESKIMKTGAFHTVRFPWLAQVLAELGYREGLLVHHLLGEDESRKWLKKLFGYEDTYPAARSLFYKLKQLGLASEGPQYLVELQYRAGELVMVIKDLHGNTVQVYTMPWSQSPPQPLEREGDKKTYVTLGVQHVKESNEASYFNR